MPQEEEEDVDVVVIPGQTFDLRVGSGFIIKSLTETNTHFRCYAITGMRQGDLGQEIRELKIKLADLYYFCL